jgi:membrane protein DedA with SNARE-associated domain/rhodanese-related sulfurtransferase
MDPLEMLQRWGLPLVFGSVLLEQSGLPLPAPPILVGAGALAAQGTIAPEAVLFAALLATLIADHAWFLAGRLRGRALLARLCRVSISPDTCVRKTDDLVARHGAPLLLVAKFIPGVSAVSIPTVAALGIPYRRFLFFDVLGSLIWCGSYVAIGMIFASEVRRALELMARFGGWSLAILGAAFAAYIGWKWWHRHKLRRLYRLVRIDPDAAARLRHDEPQTVFVDARSRLARTEDPRRIPDAIELDDGDVVQVLPLEAHGRTIVTFCTCPNEASAALLAERLIAAGYQRVRVLTGGPEALARLAR